MKKINFRFVGGLMAFVLSMICMLGAIQLMIELCPFEDVAIAEHIQGQKPSRDIEVPEEKTFLEHVADKANNLKDKVLEKADVAGEKISEVYEWTKGKLQEVDWKNMGIRVLEFIGRM